VARKGKEGRGDPKKYLTEKGRTKSQGTSNHCRIGSKRQGWLTEPKTKRSVCVGADRKAAKGMTAKVHLPWLSEQGDQKAKKGGESQCQHGITKTYEKRGTVRSTIKGNFNTENDGGGKGRNWGEKVGTCQWRKEAFWRNGTGRGESHAAWEMSNFDSEGLREEIRVI